MKWRGRGMDRGDREGGRGTVEKKKGWGGDQSLKN